MIQNWKQKFRYICGILVLLLCLLTGCTGTADGTAGRTDQDTAQTNTTDATKILQMAAEKITTF